MAPVIASRGRRKQAPFFLKLVATGVFGGKNAIFPAQARLEQVKSILPNMQHLIIELKARTRRQAEIRTWLNENGADFRGLDEQTDTYFNLPPGAGRLKIRQGTVENNLIHYHRGNEAKARASDVTLAAVADGAALKDCLTRALGVLVEVRKRREIYFVDNVKIHLDELAGLGQFIEIEAIAPAPGYPVEKLHGQCAYFMQIFGIAPEDILAESYSDLLLER